MRLYALPPAEFVEARGERAKAARADGDRDLAARIAALPKPAAAAWLADLLAGDDGDLLQRVLDLGGALREAQDRGDRDRLRSLTAERRDLLDEAAERAGALAAAAGGPAGGAALEALQRTLLAAMADDGAAAAVRSGRLVKPLAADGLDPVDLAGALGGGPAGSSASHRPAAPRATARGARDDEARALREAADAAGEEARAARREADEATDRASQEENDASERADAVQELRSRLEALEATLRDAEHERRDAERAAEHARDAARDAVRRADRAEADAEAAERRASRPPRA